MAGPLATCLGTPSNSIISQVPVGQKKSQTAIETENLKNLKTAVHLVNCIVFFSPVAADLALRLGPDSVRSGRKVCKKYETLWLHKRGKPWKNKHNKKKHGKSDDTQISQPALRFASIESSETTQKGAGATPNKKPHKSMGVAYTIGLSPPCLRKYAQTN